MSRCGVKYNGSEICDRNTTLNFLRKYYIILIYVPYQLFPNSFPNANMLKIPPVCTKMTFLYLFFFRCCRMP